MICNENIVKDFFPLSDNQLSRFNSDTRNQKCAKGIRNKGIVITYQKRLKWKGELIVTWR